MTEVEKLLHEKYGPLLTLPQLARILDRSEDGLRLTLRGNSTLAKRLTCARLKIGRRIHFRTSEVAALIEGGC